jgi:hypothetical protein
MKNVVPPLEPKFLTIWERIGEALLTVLKCSTLPRANNIGARECTAHHAWHYNPFSTNW